MDKTMITYKKMILLNLLTIMLLCMIVSGCNNKKSANTETVAVQETASETDNMVTSSSKGNPDKTSVLEIYKKILQNEAFFYNEDKEETYLSLYQDHILELNFRHFAVIDMDADGLPELVLHKMQDGSSIVMHYYDGYVYGKEYGFRGMKFLKEDGTFDWSNSAFNSGIGKLKFNGANQETIYLAENDTQDGKEIYRIDKIEVSQADYLTFTANQDKKEEIVWHELTIENILTEMKLP